MISVLGTGIPTTPAYILAVTVGGAALTNLGVDLLAAHLFVFYYAVLADVTPPVAVTAVAGAQIAGANPMTTGWHATRIGIGGFLAPFLFAFQPPLLMKGDWALIVVAFVSALVGISALSAAVAGHMFTALSWPHRLFLIASRWPRSGPISACRWPPARCSSPTWSGTAGAGGARRRCRCCGSPSAPSSPAVMRHPRCRSPSDSTGAGRVRP